MRRCVAVILASAGLCAAASPKLPWEAASQIAAGRDLYRAHCTVCHDIDQGQGRSRKLGPSLNHLFKNERLPLSHGRPSRQYVAIRIRFGGQLMPAFGKTLDDREIDTLMDYIASK
jgi:mono/diheme cytochrome c family protein